MVAGFLIIMKTWLCGNVNACAHVCVRGCVCIRTSIRTSVRAPVPVRVWGDERSVQGVLDAWAGKSRVRVCACVV